MMWIVLRRRSHSCTLSPLVRFCSVLEPIGTTNSCPRHLLQQPRLPQVASSPCSSPLHIFLRSSHRGAVQLFCHQSAPSLPALSARELSETLQPVRRHWRQTARRALRPLVVVAPPHHHPHLVQAAVVALDEVVHGHEVLAGAVAESQRVQLAAKLVHLLLQPARLQHKAAHRLHEHVQVVHVCQAGRRLWKCGGGGVTRRQGTWSRQGRARAVCRLLIRRARAVT